VKVLVTGGGGFLGRRIVGKLCDRGERVIALGRRHYPDFEVRGVETVQADVRDLPALVRAFDRVDLVFHTAALAGYWGPVRDFEQVNVDGTRNVLDACRTCGVGRLVFTSSPSVVFGTKDLCGVNESTPYPARYLAAYPRTKALAEQMVLAANGPDLATVALRPHLIFGPGDPHLIPRVIARARAGRLRRVGDGTNLVDVTYVDNAAEAHILAGDAVSPSAACAGRPYFVSQGQPVRLWPWLNDLLQAVGAPPVTRTISFSTAYRVGTFLEGVYRLLSLRGEPMMTRFLATQLAHSHYFDISAAERDLGYRPQVSTDDGVGRTVEAFRKL